MFLDKLLKPSMYKNETYALYNVFSIKVFRLKKA